ncbi:MAG TPA: hypothetical protein VGX51_12440 [Solirubrobacteraceae bacterium]|jgi:alpha-tubulin suppressor-like RCC1 family protein|nr:hypothetical protein [Solirubrobacteraceae bacterium]
MGGFGTARVTLVCVGLAIGSCLLASTGTAAAKGSKPVISNFKAAPASVPSEGTVIVSATVSGAKECTLSSSKAVAGLPATFSCESGNVNTGVLMPANTGKKAVKYKLRLIAVASTGGKSKAKATVSVSPAVPRTATVVAAGYNNVNGDYTCARLSTGHVECWGYNTYGELGDGKTTYSGTPVEVLGITEATQVTAGAGQSCALLSTRHIDCWGYNPDGELGDGTTTTKDTPVEVLGITDAIHVAAGNLDTCAVLSTGHVKCWGYNGFGELGDGSSTGPEACFSGESCSKTPVEVMNIAEATQVTNGGQNTCARLSNGHVECWGQGPLDHGTTTHSDTPVEALGVTQATQVTAASSDTCTRLSTGPIECWGGNQYGQLGDGETTTSATPKKVSGITEATWVTAGWFDTCAVVSNSHVECWGINGEGELGNGKTGNPSDTPVKVSGISEASQVTAGRDHACARLSTGHIECWGNNQYGQLGDGEAGNESDTPKKVKGI